MSNKSFEGKWILVGSASDKSENTFLNNAPNQDNISNWLETINHKLLDKLITDEGFHLLIGQDGKFVEQKIKSLKADYYNNEGVLDNSAEPFSGHILDFNGKTYIVSDKTPSFGKPKEDRYNAILRYDDSDTKICESLDIVNDQLIRTINVVTDEIYFDRIMLVYSKS